MPNIPMRKIILYVLLAIVAVFLWRAYQAQNVKNNIHKVTAQSALLAQASQKGNAKDQNAINNGSNTSFTPKSFTPKSASSASAAMADESHSITPTQSKSTIDPNQLVNVKTSTLAVTIDLNTGSIHTLGLPSYPVSLQDKAPFTLFAQNESHNYQSQSGLVDSKGQNLNVHYTSSQNRYVMNPSDAQLVVTLIGHASNGLEVVKTYTFAKNSYVIHVGYKITNHGSKAQKYSFYGQLTRQPSKMISSMATNRAYKGAAISSATHPYREIKYKWLNENQLIRPIIGGWIAQQQQYFITAWVPKAHETNQYYSNTVFKLNKKGKQANIYTVGFVAPSMSIAQGETQTASAKLYAGPEIATRLKLVSPGLDISVDYGWLWMLSKLIFTVMAFIDSVVHNWGFAIILTTLVIKLCFYKLSAHSYKSMAKMKRLAPKIKTLKDRLSGDKAAISKATMELYRKEKVNPAGGCLPMVVQIPFFFALYYVLINSVQLRQAPFIFWIKDLAIHDPYYILPVLVGISMFLQQRMSPPPPDPAQAKMMMLLPVVFTVFFLKFPAGLTLYWLTNNLLTLLQQWYVMRKFDNPEYIRKQREKDREKDRRKKNKKSLS